MKALEEKIGYVFKNKDLLTEALTHSSYANEQGNLESNERMEFLGDAVLSIVSAEYLYKKFPDLPEGKLSKIRSSLVCTQSLSSFSRELGVGDYLLLGRGEKTRFWKTHLRQSLPQYISTEVCLRLRNLY